MLSNKSIQTEAKKSLLAFYLELVYMVDDKGG